MRIRYPDELTSGLYELQFATNSSKNHSHYFGGGDKTVLAFYFGNLVKLESWLEAVLPYKKLVESNFGSPVNIGLWGKSWVMIGLKLDNDDYGTDPDPYANVFARFIEATWEPIKQVYITLGIR